MSDPFADLFPRRRERERAREGGGGRPRPDRDVFVDHARQVLLARWGTSLSNRMATLPEGQFQEFPLVSGNGRIVGEVVWLDGMESADWRSATLSERAWVMSHVLTADRRFLLIVHDPDLVSRWLAGHRGMFGGVEVWSLDGDQLERLA